MSNIRLNYKDDLYEKSKVKDTHTHTHTYDPITIVQHQVGGSLQYLVH